MEVRFRPFPQSLLVRRTGPGQAAPESGLNFLEIVESVTGAENNAEEKANSSEQNRQSFRKALPSAAPVSGEENSESATENPQTSPAQKDPEPKPLGHRTDMTA